MARPVEPSATDIGSTSAGASTARAGRSLTAMARIRSTRNIRSPPAERQYAAHVAVPVHNDDPERVDDPVGDLVTHGAEVGQLHRPPGRQRLLDRTDDVLGQVDAHREDAGGRSVPPEGRGQLGGHGGELVAVGTPGDGGQGVERHDQGQALIGGQASGARRGRGRR